MKQPKQKKVKEYDKIQELMFNLVEYSYSKGYQDAMYCYKMALKKHKENPDAAATMMFESLKEGIEKTKKEFNP